MFSSYQTKTNKTFSAILSSRISPAQLPCASSIPAFISFRKIRRLFYFHNIIAFIFILIVIKMFSLVSGIITSGGARMVGERLTGSGTRLDVTPPLQLVEPTGVGNKSSTESVHRTLKSVSRQSLLGKGLSLVTNRVYLLISSGRFLNGNTVRIEQETRH